ncbi:Phospholipase D gamma 1 [Bienertia sinuspersici]
MIVWVLVNTITLGIGRKVYEYRMSLWAEHLGGLFEEENLECVRVVSNIADKKWKKFVADNYSVRLCRDGKVHSLHFPDVGGKVLGTANSIADALTKKIVAA